jgi:hypothetical protein
LIAALEKADHLARLQKHDGVPATDFAVVLTVKEGFELIDWFLEQDEHPANLEVLARDVAMARTTKDPNLVLQHFTLRGFPIVMKKKRH